MLIPTIVTATFRKVLHYSIFISLLAVAGLTIAMWLSRNDLQSALNASIKNQELIAEKLDKVEIINQTQSDTITLMERVIKSNSEIAQKLNNDIQHLSATERDIRKKLLDIEKANLHVQNYLNITIPAELRSLLSDAESGNPDGGTVSSD